MHPQKSLVIPRDILEEELLKMKKIVDEQMQNAFRLATPPPPFQVASELFLEISSKMKMLKVPRSGRR
jgi:hypothetical protein